jgi:hypothetical protein
MAFKLTYATMFNPPEELHTGFDAAVSRLKQNLGKEYGMIIDARDVFADEKMEDRSPVNTDWVLARMQKGTPGRATGDRGGGGLTGLVPDAVAGTGEVVQVATIEHVFSSWRGGTEVARTAWSHLATCRRPRT